MLLHPRRISARARRLASSLALLFAFWTIRGVAAPDTLAFLDDLDGDGLLDFVVEPLMTDAGADPDTGVRVIWGDERLRLPEELFGPLLEGEERTDVLVSIAGPPNLRSWSDHAARATHRGEIEAAQDRFMASMTKGVCEEVNRLANVPVIRLRADAEGLQALLDRREVVTIEPVLPLRRALAQGIPTMHADTFRDVYGGQGVTIAIADDGVDYTHISLGGGAFPNAKVIGGFDFANNDADPFPTGPGNVAHGTAVAGIAAGSTTGSFGDYIGGIAPRAKLALLKIFPDNGGDTDSGLLAQAWDWSITNQFLDPTHPILVVNSSLGGLRFTSVSTCESALPSLAAAGQSAVAAGITLVASAGNEGYCNALSFPACLSPVLSVGGVYDGANLMYGTCVEPESCLSATTVISCPSPLRPVIDTMVLDRAAKYSNSATFLDLLAPSDTAFTTDIVGPRGYNSTSGTAGNYSPADPFFQFGGTSAASPYAAGAVAALQSAIKASRGTYLSPSQVRSALRSTGKPITDAKSNIATPRIDLASAIALNAISPATPANLWAEPGPNVGEIVMGWDATLGAQTYTIYYDDDASFPPFDPSPQGNPASGTDVGSARQVTIRGLTPLKLYRLSVVANNGSGSSDLAAAVAAVSGDGTGDDFHEQNDTVDTPVALAYNSGVTTYSNLQLRDDDWYRLAMTTGRHLRITATFEHNRGDLQLQLWDRRSAINDFGSLLGESFLTADTEIITYVNSTTPPELLLRVYGEGGATNGNYTLKFETFDLDDALELATENDFICQPLTTLTPGTYLNLIARDDDWYRLDVSGLGAIDVRADHKFFSGNLHLMVAGDVPSDCGGVYNRILAGGFSNNAGQNYEEILNVPVAGRSTVLVRVFGAIRDTNFYDLTFGPASGRTQPSSDATETLPAPDAAAAEPRAAVEPCIPSAVSTASDDAYEENDTFLEARPIDLTTLTDGEILVVNDLVSGDDDWYAIDLRRLQHVRIRMAYDFAVRDVQMQLWDRRPAIGLEFGRRVGESFHKTNEETITYVNASDPGTLDLRVYVDNPAAPRTPYCLTFETFQNDDPFDLALPNNEACFPSAIAANVTYPNLILRDDDWYRLDVSAFNTIDVRVDHQFFSGNLHLMVVKEVGGCAAAYDHVIAGGFSDDAGAVEQVLGIRVNDSDYDHVLIRVYGAIRDTNFYDLTVTPH